MNVYICVKRSDILRKKIINKMRRMVQKCDKMSVFEVIERFGY